MDPNGTNDLGPGAGVFAFESPVLGRAVELGMASGRLVSVSFPETLPADADAVHGLVERFQAYLEGAEDDFRDVEVALTVPTAHRGVLEATRNVPYGEAVDLARVVKMTPDLDHEDETDLATAREALAANPIPVVIADHRVRRVEGATPPDVAEKLRRLEGIDA